MGIDFKRRENMTLYLAMWISLIVMIAMNALANIIPLNNQTTGEISNKLDVLFTPAGYVFSIWSVIYILLIIWLMMIYKPMRRHDVDRKIGFAFIASCVWNIAWLICWHFEFFNTSIVFMLLLLVTLIFIYSNYTNNEQTFAKRLPFSIYLAWISVATIANISYVLKYNGVTLGINELFGSFVLVILAAALAILAVKVSRDLYFLAVITWALIGVSVANDHALMSTGTGIVVGIMVLISLYIYAITEKSSSA